MERVETRPLTVVSIVLLVVPWAMMALRIYTRVGIKKMLLIDDALVITAILTFSVATILIAQMLNTKLDNLPANYDYIEKVFYATTLLYIVAAVTAKLSFSVTLLTVANTHQRYMLYILIAVLSIFSTFFCIWLLITCNPATHGHSQCSHASILKVLNYINGAFMITADVIVVTITIWVLKKVMIKRRKKIIIGAFMSLSATSFGATIVRMIYIPQAVTSDNFIQMTTTITLWTVVETGSFITVTAASVLHPLVSKFWETAIQWSSSHSRRRQSEVEAGNIVMIPVKASIRGQKEPDISRFSRHARTDASVSGEYLILDGTN
ncbi:hypothetical protein BGW36DRAFT_422934 [Talaromyces proteolyticus]|uniref:Rhodopsin domain-containing protein n=1 Tax=Talaromyces proteolyticus TaxID=1131652 RepID=A0AAD4Q4Q7_9EURO|nr:uncharacterized protein BGW36DRAFT_422934 [Talaromyces proteolyticus]KAH8703369.1 hypothetical protein BGW36DRAFT_422934 [Talaromyces proteolyticus]